MSLNTSPPKTVIVPLLTRAGLPSSDLPDGPLPNFFAWTERGETVGVVGCELHGESALLRSLAVSPEARGRGKGAALVGLAESLAVLHGAKAIFLLTQGAQSYFERLGYRAISRSEAPASIRDSSQFKSLCPATAALLGKTLPAGGVL